MMDKESLDLALNVARDYVCAGKGQPYRGQMQLILEHIAAQAAEIDRLKGLLDVNRNVSVGVQLYDAELFREKDAEIDRLKAASERSCAESLLLRDMEHERCRVARQEADRLKKALEEAEGIRDDLVSNADSIGELIFGEYIPDANGNDRYGADGYEGDPSNPDDYSVPAYSGMSIEVARQVALLINEMLDSDWVDTTGKRQIHSPIVATEFDPDEAIMIACPQCGTEQQDFDGFGVVHCEACGYCVHPSSTGGVCDICRKVQP